MLKILKVFGFAFLCFIFSSDLISQSWESKNDVTNKADFNKIVTDFDLYWLDRPQSKGNGYKPFKRWQYKWESRNTKTGLPNAGVNYKAFNQYLKDNPDPTRDESDPWISLGPNDTGTGYEGRGRVMSIGFHPTNTNILYVGSAGGGLWKSIDGGNTWTPKTDMLGSLGVSGIIIDPINPNIIYIGTGDGDASDNYSIGVLKSLNGGDTWNVTGLDWSTSSGNLIRNMVLDPNDNNTILAATNRGVYRTSNAGANWTNEVTGNFYDVEIDTDAASNTFYAATGSEILQSTDNGANWGVIQTIPNSSRLSIATTAGNDDLLYILSSGNSNGANGGSGFNGLYMCTNNGANMTLQSDTPNVLSGAIEGDASGGQGWYDLAIAADPDQPNTIYVAGVNNWKSTDGGVTWELMSHWYGGGGVQSVHADKHLLEFQDNGTLWEGNDGGIYRTTNDGQNWTDLTGDMVISQMYRLTMSETDNKALTGLQDNGTLIKENNNTWDHVIGGDGMDCAIHPANAQVMYGEYQFGNIRRSTNGGNNWTNIKQNIPGNPGGAWITPLMLDPTDEDVVFAGFQDIFKSTDQGDSWVALGTGAGTETKTHLIMSPIDNNVMYTGNSNSLYSSTDAGVTWTSMSAPNGNMRMIAASPSNTQTLYATQGGYSNGNKIYKSTNNGKNWTNISGNLPNIPCNAVAIHDDGKETVYLGMDVGVYFKNEDTPDWTLFNVDLPNAMVSDLDIREASQEIYIATYGRGLWKNDAIGTNSSCGFPKSLEISEVVLNLANISWSPPSTPPASGYEWILNQSQIPTGTSTSTMGTSLLIEDIQDGLEYYFHIRSDCGGQKSSWSTYGPFGSLGSDFDCGDTSFDTGGPTSNYSDNEDEIWTICPEQSTATTTVTFNTFNVESNYDALYVYDGRDVSSPLFPGGATNMSNNFPLGGFYGTTNPGPFTSTNSSGCITFRFRSDGSVTRSGWDADVTCTELCNTTVTTLNDNGSGSLREAIECAVNGNTITFAADVWNETIGLNSPILVSSDITLFAPPNANINISVSGSGPVFNNKQGQLLSLENLSLVGGTGDVGAAIQNSGFMLLSNITSNSTSTSSSFESTIWNGGVLKISGENTIVK